MISFPNVMAIQPIIVKRNHQHTKKVNLEVVWGLKTQGITKFRRSHPPDGKGKKALTVRHRVIDEDCSLPRFSQDAIHRHTKDKLKALSSLQVWLSQVIQNGDLKSLHADARGKVQVTTDAYVVDTSWGKDRERDKWSEKMISFRVDIQYIIPADDCIPVWLGAHLLQRQAQLCENGQWWCQSWTNQFLSSTLWPPHVHHSHPHDTLPLRSKTLELESKGSKQ